MQEITGRKRDKVWAASDLLSELTVLDSRIAVRMRRRRRIDEVKAPLSATGGTVRMWHSLTGPFGRQARLALQGRAAKERKKRLKRAARTSITITKDQP
ncbi:MULTISPECIES: hypothetical protein [Microbacterium]|uniref:hypothetical protein n=1 Tax=Microbacterium TaxID=33882 RepID=UPI00277F8A44|nr:MULTISPECIES: hypothetical protein [Microbacterium]MDQ1074724.1 hypothetical protein [Microbacterium sp. SORGH_AS_0969]MDQ1114949.1 hypothetical protein [Microbacterium testaceum]